MTDPIFKKSQSIPSLDAYIAETGDKRKVKSSYYAIKYALQLLPDLLEIVDNPAITKLYRVCDLQIRSRSIVLLINNAWQFINDHGDSNEILKGFIGTKLQAIQELRAKCEVIALGEAAAIRPRQDKWKKNNDQTTKDWKQILRDWLNSDYSQPLQIENLNLSAKEVAQYKMLLSGMGDIFEYVVDNHIITISKRKEEATV